MNDDPIHVARPPQMPASDRVNPYTAPVQPPLLPVAHADPFQVTADDRTMGMLVHLLALLTGFLGTLILWLVKKDTSRFVDFHGKEAINFQITLLIYVFSLMAFGIVTMGAGMLIAVPLIIVLSIAAFVFELMACLAANRGEWHRYPMTIRLIK